MIKLGKEKQNIKCDVHSCKHCNCDEDHCGLREVEIKNQSGVAKDDKISNNKREKAKNVILKTLELEKGDSFIVLSNVTREGKDKILNEIESLIEEEETL